MKLSFYLLVLCLMWNSLSRTLCFLCFLLCFLFSDTCQLRVVSCIFTVFHIISNCAYFCSVPYSIAFSNNAWIAVVIECQVYIAVWKRYWFIVTFDVWNWTNFIIKKHCSWLLSINGTNKKMHAFRDVIVKLVIKKQKIVLDRYHRASNGRLGGT